MRRLAILILLASSLSAQDATRLEFTAGELPAKATYWYGVYMMKNKIGWVQETTGRTREGRIRYAYDMRMQIVGPGGLQKMHMSQTLVFDAKPPYRLYSGADLNDMGAGETKTVLTRTEKGYKAAITGPGAAREVAVEIDFTLADQFGAEIWIRRGGRKVGDRITTYSFDMDDLEVTRDTFVIQEIRDALVAGVRQKVFVAHGSNSKSGELGVALATGNGKLFSMALGGAVEARREPKEIAQRLDESVDMFALSSVPVDKPLGDPSTISSLVLEARGTGVHLLANGPRQSVTPGEEADTRVVKIGAAHGNTLKATEEEWAEATAADHRYPAKDATVVALANTAVGDAATAREKVARLVPFVAKYVRDDYGPEYTSALGVIHAKAGDCSAHATLFVALARAVGVPAREVNGYVYIGDEARALGGHAWCEVILDGHWVEVDPTWNEVELNPTHLSFRGKHAETEMIKVLGQLSLRVIEIQRK